MSTHANSTIAVGVDKDYVEEVCAGLAAALNTISAGTWTHWRKEDAPSAEDVNAARVAPHPCGVFVHEWDYLYLRGPGDMLLKVSDAERSTYYGTVSHRVKIVGVYDLLRADGENMEYNDYAYVGNASITVDSRRGAAVIAKDVARRLLPDYAALLEKVRENKASRLEQKRRKEQTYTLLHHIITPDAPINDRDLSSRDTTISLRIGADAGGGYRYLRFHVDGSADVRLEGSVSVADALALATMFKQS